MIRAKPVGRAGSLLIVVGSFSSGYFLGALANCTMKCNNMCSTLK